MLRFISVYGARFADALSKPQKGNKNVKQAIINSFSVKACLIISYDEIEQQKIQNIFRISH